MTAKEQAHSLIKKHLTVIAEESMDGGVIIFYTAKQCALVTVDVILNSRPGCPYPFELGLEIQGIVNIINYPDTYWKEVKKEIKNMTHWGFYKSKKL